MSEHSKGPWTLDEHGDVRDANGKRVRLVGVSLACGYAPNDREPEANRALVAASPDLVEVVLRLLVGVGAQANEGIHAAYHTEADVQAARAALEKAGVKP